MARIVPLCALLAAAACNQHDVYGFRAGVWVGDRGIAIPVPPPSLTDAPVQPSRIEGSFDVAAEEGVSPPVQVELKDLVSGAEASVEIDELAGDFLIEEVVLDHTDNCLEFRLVLSDGRASDVERYHTVIETDDRTVRVVDGCAD
jgi:hypothetical protein